MNEPAVGSACPLKHRSLAEWTRPLTVTTVTLFLFLSISGLVIYLAGFSLLNQFMVLAHTALGFVFVIPYSVYQLQHWRGVRSQPVTNHKVLGYSAFVAIVVCAITGLVLSLQAAAGTHVSYLMDLLHTISGFAAFAIVIGHVAFLVAINLKLRRTELAVPMRVAQRGFFLRVGTATALLVAATFLLTVVYRPFDTRYQLPSDYSYKYGAEKGPYYPSLARTDGMKAVMPKALAESRTCGANGCHEQIVEEWTPSAHRWASMDFAFQAIQHVMATNEGPESTRYCAGCHDPVALFSGSKNIYDADLTSYGADEGVSCLVCHSIKETDVKGNANYVLAEPVRYAFELQSGAVPQFLSSFLIRSYPKQHVASYSRDLYKTPEFCGACHKQFIDQSINRVGWVQLQNQYDNWKASHWNQKTDPNQVLTCRDCHMRLTASRDPAAGDRQDFNRAPDDGKHRNHRFIGANQWVPAFHKLDGAEQQVKLTQEWLQGKTEVPEINDRWHQGAVVDLKIDAPDQVRAGDTLHYKVILTSNKVGHDFPTGPLDIIQCWVDTDVQAGEQVVYHSGKLDDLHFIEKDSFIFKAEGIDKQGNLIDRHNLWEMVGARFKRSLFPGFTDQADFAFTCPSMNEAARPAMPPQQTEHELTVPGDGKRALRIQATLKYRKFDQYLLNYMQGGSSALTSPVTDMVSVTKEIRVQSKSTSRSD
ncbi:MAG: multiheme c-type cytochrome [Planctomycetota bacterium]